MLKLKPISSVLAALMITSALSGCGGETALPTSAPSQTTPDSVALAAAAAAEAAATAATKAAVEAAVAEATKVAEEAAAVEAAKVAKAAKTKAASEAKAAAAPAPVPAVFKMPKLVGENLQLAQDMLQALGSYVLDQEDAAGLSRIQVLDSNWQVCAQRPTPGKEVPVETVVFLSSVKLSEQCP